MNHRHQRSVDSVSTYAGDQQKVVEKSPIDTERVMHAEPAMNAPKEVKELFEAFELEIQSPDEIEEFLKAWESMPDEARFIF